MSNARSLEYVHMFVHLNTGLCVYYKPYVHNFNVYVNAQIGNEDCFKRNERIEHHMEHVERMHTLYGRPQKTPT